VLSKLSTDALRALCVGSAAAAAIRRAGGADLVLSENATPFSGTCVRNPYLDAMVAERRDELISFLAREREHGGGFDQELAFAVALRFVEGAFPLDVSSSRTLPAVAIVGLAGSGKTYTIGRLVKALVAQGRSVRVVAPTNTAAKVLGNALAGHGVEFGGNATVMTAHKALRELCLTNLGRAVFTALENGRTRVDSVDADPVQLAEVNEILGTFEERRGRDERAQSRFKRALVSCYREVFGGGTKIVVQACSRVFRMAGFEELDSRLLWWAPLTSTVDVFIIDEASMIPSRFVRDAAAVGSRVIVVGDSYQIPPVTCEHVDARGFVYPDVPALTLLDQYATVHLQHSRRQAGESAVPELAAKCFVLGAFKMRDAIRDAAGAYPGFVRVFSSLKEVPPEDLKSGPTLCFTNDKRHAVNPMVRRLLGLPADRPAVGDRLAVVVKGAMHAVEKDERFVISAVHEALDGKDPLFEITSEADPEKVLILPLRLGDERLSSRDDPRGAYLRAMHAGWCEFAGPEYWGEDLPTFALAHAQTTHKAQGGGWACVTLMVDDIVFKGVRADRIALPDGRIPPAWCRLLYTALTRTRGHVNCVLGC
jgi:hypothetical protein